MKNVGKNRYGIESKNLFGLGGDGESSGLANLKHCGSSGSVDWLWHEVGI